MNQQLFDSLCNKVDNFIEHFEKVPLRVKQSGMPWEQFYFNYFTSMTTVLANSFHYLNYALLQDNKKSIDHICLTFNSNNELIRGFNLDLNNNSNHQTIVNYIKKKLPLYRQTKQRDQYQKFLYKNTPDSINNFFVSGTSYVDNKSENITFNIFSVFFKPQIEKEKINFTITKSKENCQEIQNDFTALNDCSVNALSTICSKYNIDESELDNHFMYYFGDTLLGFCRKERLIKSLELLFFTNLGIKDIAQECGYKDWNELQNLIHKIPTLENLPIIRYNHTNN